jgi:hypothetical protein
MIITDYWVPEPRHDWLVRGRVVPRQFLKTWHGQTETCGDHAVRIRTYEDQKICQTVTEPKQALITYPHILSYTLIKQDPTSYLS